MRDPSVRLVGDPLSERLDESRLADPGLPGEKHRLTLTTLGEVPALEEKFQFLLTPNERAQARCVECLEAALRCACAGDPPSVDRLSEAPQLAWSEVLDLEQPADQAPCLLSDDDFAAPGHDLQASGEVRGIADDRFLLRRASAEEVTYDDDACRDPNPRGKCAAIWRPQTVHGLDNREAGCHRPLSLILVRVRPAEVGQHAVTHELGKVSLEARDLPRDGVLVGSQRLPHVLRIEPRGKGRRADKVDEHHRELAAFRVGRPPD